MNPAALFRRCPRHAPPHADAHHPAAPLPDARPAPPAASGDRAAIAEGFPIPGGWIWLERAILPCATEDAWQHWLALTAERQRKTPGHAFRIRWLDPDGRPLREAHLPARLPPMRRNPRQEVSHGSAQQTPPSPPWWSREWIRLDERPRKGKDKRILRRQTRAQDRRDARRAMREGLADYEA
ncbi:protein of unknown function [Candidatus Hydrogenisulfobacillus filiaventi]|uniref:Uncharacterized protein n=1 Tax=Candidatus Hydrogenisulfobacillus filiaventi TaxID=2707344 RepID=A0A6F8ZI72_9FIRM|nr:protein of unknown function [Candidatus Hydrogenisulfobacillus filiaventi]